MIRDLGGTLQLDMAGEGADPDDAVLDGDAAERGDAAEIEQKTRRQEPHVERWQQALVTGEQCHARRVRPALPRAMPRDDSRMPALSAGCPTVLSIVGSARHQVRFSRRSPAPVGKRRKTALRAAGGGTRPPHRGNRFIETAIEYGLIAALIAVAIIGAVTLVGTNLNVTFNTVAGAL